MCAIVVCVLVVVLAVVLVFVVALGLGVCCLDSLLVVRRVVCVVCACAPKQSFLRQSAPDACEQGAAAKAEAVLRQGQQQIQGQPQRQTQRQTQRETQRQRETQTQIAVVEN